MLPVVVVAEVGAVFVGVLDVVGVDVGMDIVPNEKEDGKRSDVLARLQNCCASVSPVMISPGHPSEMQLANERAKG